MRAHVLVVPALAILFAACSSEPPAPAESTSKVSAPIINGNVDTTHQAVVALALQSGQQGGLCSGTIVKTDPQRKVGWVLTAAHCVAIPPVLAIQGNDFQATDALHYDIIDFTADPRYVQGGNAGQPYDFAVVRIAGVDATTPVIPITSAPDNVTTGTPFVAVGYGRTTLIQSGAQDTNTVRRNVSLSVSQLVGSAQYLYNQQARGTCQGDSGGPDLVGSGASERVIGVHSYVEGDCDYRAGSGRVTGDLQFIQNELAKVPAAGCDLCSKAANSGKGECAALTQKCFQDTECRAYYDCIASCTTPTCRKTCLTKHPLAEGPFTAAAGCACNRACQTECANTFECSQTPKCGFRFPAGDCTTCTEGACCQEALDCGSDGFCYLCLKTKDADPKCADNRARKKLANCVASACKDACAGSGLDTPADPASEEQPGDPAAPKKNTTTEETSGCAVASAPSSSSGAPGLFGAALGVALAAALRRRRSHDGRAPRS
jgi:MYXO-CTERM domain-containing protein